MRNGDVAIATVTSTSSSPSKPNRNDDVRTVEYPFHDQSGDLSTGSNVDPTFMLREGSALLVYYDAENPSQQVAQCAGYYQVAGLAPDWLEEVS